ncbi:MAG: hypothetical protein HKN94_03220 [Acidimicrobiales bacterium]|nr:hypothetical protein [Acidimicrobiales bacterium]
MTELSGAGVRVDLPRGWEGEIFNRAPEPTRALSTTLPTGETARNVIHLANFSLPTERGDFGSGAVELMNSGAVLVILFEHGPESVDTPLFARSGIPTLSPQDFDPQQMQRTLSGQSGRQVFFNVAGRAFCLYVVLGSHRQRGMLVPVVNEVLANLVIEPAG